MGFLETIERARAFLQRNGRVSLRALRREFDLDDATLEELIEELVDIQGVARRDEHTLTCTLTWVSKESEPSIEKPAADKGEPPSPGAGSAPAGGGTPVEAGEPDAAVADAAERRQLTVLFCDLVGSTALGERLDSEDFRVIVARYYDAAREVTDRYAGHVAQYLGDGLLVYFGYPRAHEDDAERAVRAGLDIVAAVARLNEVPGASEGEPLGVRVGIHTGPVVVGELGRHGRDIALGDTLNVAARIQGVAAANTVVLSATTLRLVSGIFVTQDLGTVSLAGVSAPMRLHCAVRPSGVRSRLDVAAATGLTPFVGREQELMLLEDRFAQVTEGSGQAVLITGEAGIGKSRLVQAFRERLAERAHSWLECRGSPYTQDSALYPVMELHCQGLGFRPDDTSEKKLSQLEAGLAVVDFDLKEMVPVVAALHGVPLGTRYVSPNLSPEGMRKKTLHLLREWMLRLGQRQPLVLLLEDLHWMDPSSVELVGQVLEQLPTAPVLLLATFRPDFQPPWGSRSHVTPMLLSRLTRAQLGDLVRKAARGRTLPQAWVDEILRHADGVPLFAEELTRAVVETNAELPPGATAPPLQVPETLQDSLMARLDALGGVKDLVQIGSVLGREFSYDLLLRVSPMKETELQQMLGAAVREEVFYQRGSPPDATYLFKHALIRDAAYESMLRSTRQRHHERVAETLMNRLPVTADVQPELVAHHLSAAGAEEQAIGWWIRSGERAAARAGYAEAVSYFRRGLTLLPAVADADARRDLELTLHIRLGVVLVSSQGYAAPVTQETWERARSLSDVEGDPERAGLVRYYLASRHGSEGNYPAALSLSQEVRSIGQRSGDLALELAGHVVSGVAFQYGGRLAESRAAFQAACDLSDRGSYPFLERGFQEDPGVSAWGWLAWGEWAAGFPDRARTLARTAVERASVRGHPYTVSLMKACEAVGALYRREWADARRLGAETARLADEQGFPLPAAVATLAEAGAAVLGDGETDGIDRFAAAIDAAAATGNRALSSLILGVFAELLLAAGRPEEAGQQLDGALAIAEAIGEGFYLAELHRLRGEVCVRLQQNGGERGAGEAEACFRQAIEIARRQGARTFELRAATSLARLWHGSGKHSDARKLLEPVYASFTEGFDTVDMRTARALLDEGGA